MAPLPLPGAEWQAIQFASRIGTTSAEKSTPVLLKMSVRTPDVASAFTLAVALPARFEAVTSNS